MSRWILRGPLQLELEEDEDSSSSYSDTDTDTDTSSIIHSQWSVLIVQRVLM